MKEKIIGSLYSVYKRTIDLIIRLVKKPNKKIYIGFILSYVAFPIISIGTMYFYIVPYFLNMVIGLKIEDVYIINSDFAINNVFSPFITFTILFFAFVLIYIIITKHLANKFNKDIYMKLAKRILKLVEIVTLLSGLITMIYTKSEEFPYTNSESYISFVKEKDSIFTPHYEITEINNDEEPNINSPAPTIKSTGFTADTSSVFYNLLIRLSLLFFSISKYFGVIVTISGTIFFPLKKFVDNNSIPVSTSTLK